jgi:hypothetical protein
MTFRHWAGLFIDSDVHSLVTLHSQLHSVKFESIIACMYKTFHYPDGSRACASGQRRCAMTAMDLTSPGNNERKEQLLQRAVKTERRLQKGMDVPKHDKLDYVVVDAFTKGTLPKYVHTKKGDFTLHTYDGRKYPNNIFQNKKDGKHIY